MAERGRKMSDDERRSKDVVHLLHYNIAMAVREDNGAKVNLATEEGREQLIESVAASLRGKTAREAAEYVVEREMRKIDGIRTRQKPTITELRERFKAIIEILNRVSRSGTTGKVTMERSSFNRLRELVFGTKVDVQEDILV